MNCEIAFSATVRLPITSGQMTSSGNWIWPITCQWWCAKRRESSKNRNTGHLSTGLL